MFVEPTLFVLLLAEGAGVPGSAGAAVAELGPGRGLALAPAAAVVPAGVPVPRGACGSCGHCGDPSASPR